MMTLLRRLKRRLPDVADEALLLEMLRSGQAYVRAQTGRDTLPEALDDAALAVAAVLCNRMGMEGETLHTEGGISRQVSGMPDEVERLIRPYRLAKTVG